MIPRYFMYVALLVWLIGIWLASRIALPNVVLGFAVGVAVVSIILSWRAPKPQWVFVLSLAAVLGALRFNLAQPHFDQTTLAAYNHQPQPIVVEGVVISEPDARDACTNLRIQADRLILADQTGGLRAGLVTSRSA